MKLNDLKVLGGDNKTMINVYDGDVYSTFLGILWLIIS